MQLLELFHELTVRSQNAKELKGLILQLAVQGKLTAKWRLENSDIKIDMDSLAEQLDLTASELKVHASEISNLIVPDSWAKAKFSLVFDMKGGSQPPKSNFISEPKDGYVQLYQIRDFGSKPQPVYVPIDSVSKFCSTEDVMIGRYGASIGKIFYGKDGAYNVALVKLIWNKEVLLQQYVYQMFSSRYIQEFFESCSRSAQAGFNKTDMGEINITLPPLQEQKAIVKIVESLFKEVEQLESLTAQRVQLKEDYATSALRQLAEGNTSQEWQQLEPQFSAFFDNEVNIKKLRETILQLAVQGKLTADWRKQRALSGVEVEPASELLKRIQTEKERLIAEKKIKNEKLLPPISEDEIPYALPDGWVWCRMGEISEKLGAGSTPSGGKSAYVEIGVMFFRSQNIYNHYLKLQDVAKIPEATHEKMKGTKVRSRDILLNITGGSIGRCALISDDFTTANVSQHVAIVRMIELETRKYIHQFIISPGFQNRIMDVQVGVSREGLSMTKLKMFPIPLPPLQEQKAIVAKVNQLMAYCNELEEQVNQSQAHSVQLMQSVLREVFE